MRQRNMKQLWQANLITTPHRDILDIVKELRPHLVDFSQREKVSPIEMVSLIGTLVLDIGIRLEAKAGMVRRKKSYAVPLAGEMLELIAEFGECQHVDPIEMLSVLGATIIDLGAEIQSAVNTGTWLN
jgi:hypothetical protein